MIRLICCILFPSMIQSIAMNVPSPSVFRLIFAFTIVFQFVKYWIPFRLWFLLFLGQKWYEPWSDLVHALFFLSMHSTERQKSHVHTYFRNFRTSCSHFIRFIRRCLPIFHSRKQTDGRTGLIHNKIDLNWKHFIFT